MPAYSGTPLAQKLGIKDGRRYTFVNAPVGFTKELPTLPPSAIAVSASARTIDLIVLFAPDRKTLSHKIPTLVGKLPAAGALWIAWPKQGSGVTTDLRENVVRHALLAIGLVDIKVCSINETYSALKFVRRCKDR